MKYSLYWIGIRESEIHEVCDLFSGSITIFGSGLHGNHAFEREFKIRYDYNKENDAWYRFVICKASELIKKDPNCQFLLYDTDEMELYGPEVASRTVCKNPASLLQLLSNKFQARQWLSEYVPILPYQMLCGSEISYIDQQKSFPETHAFVVQSSYSCGGSGTWLLNEANQDEILNQLDFESVYAVSPYQNDSISLNIHMLLFENNIILFSPSVQLIKISSHNFTYRGADYPMYRMLPNEMDQLLREYAQKLGNILRKAGYRGICGIDFLFSAGKLYFMEINARFQSSTFLINQAMRQAGWGTSMQALHMAAFQKGFMPRLPEEPLEVPFSFYHYAYEAARREQLQSIHKLLINTPQVNCIDDSLDWGMKLESGTYLYKAIFLGPISAPGPKGECRCHGNVFFPALHQSPSILKQDLERLKLLLLAHGVRLSEEAKSDLEAKGGFNHEEFDALDLVLKGHIYICAPYNTNRSYLSPFCIDAAPGGGYSLTCYDTIIMDVQVRLVDALGGKQTHDGILYHDITYLSNDRLRVYHRLGCYFKDCEKACQFCDLPGDVRALPLKDIYQAIDEYQKHPKVRHYLIGGGSNSPDDNFERVATIAKHIWETTKKPIYLMSLPPKDTKILLRLKESGITQVAFNLEIFDRDLALRYMPGKGAIPFDAYDQAFRTAVKLWGKTGNVRTIFVVGLESKDSLLHGISYVAKLGVSPILSLFRPAPDTLLQKLLPPPDNEIWQIYQQAKEICKQNGVSLGPTCPYCEDNCLKITL